MASVQSFVEDASEASPHDYLQPTRSSVVQQPPFVGAGAFGGVTIEELPSAPPTPPPPPPPPPMASIEDRRYVDPRDINAARARSSRPQ